MKNTQNLAPPSLSVNTHTYWDSTASTLGATSSRHSTNSNPFLTPAASNDLSITPNSSRPPSSLTLQGVNRQEALRPDPGTEADFKVDDNPFAFSPGQLNKLLNPKSLAAYRALGGLAGIARGLQADLDSGLSVDETNVPRRITFDEAVEGDDTKAESSVDSGAEPFGDRTRVYGRNVLPTKKATPLWRLMWNAYNDKVLILLTVAAFISLALGLYETLGVYHPPGSPPAVDWIEGVAICVAIIIVVAVGSLNDWQKEKAFVRLNEKKEDREIKVVRSGKAIVINVHDILVGDIVNLEPGDLIPVDGIFISGDGVKCDESSATGESDALKKIPGEQVYKILESGQPAKSGDLDPFIISGAKVLEGVGTFLCTSVGVNSSFGKIMMSVRTEVEATPLQKKLEGLASAIAKIGGSVALLLFFILFIRFLASLPGDTSDGATKASAFMDILIVAITIIVVAVPEGLPLAVTLALAFAATRMLKQNNLVRMLRACETMGNATTICSDKTGTLTTNKMTVVAGSFGASSFSKPESEDHTQTISHWASNLSADIKEAIIQSVAINSTAFEGEVDGKSTFIGSKTETALLQLALDHLGMGPVSQTRSNVPKVQMFPFDSQRKCMGAVIKVQGGGYRLLVKGAAEILLEYCSSQADITDLSVSPLAQNDRDTLLSTIETYARQSLRTIGIVYRDYEQWPPTNANVEDGAVEFLSVLKDLVFLGVVGIQDPVRPGVPESVKKAQHAGVVIRMVTGDNAVTARSIATECGILSEGDVVMEGPVFRALSDDEMDRTLPKLRVLARSSPEDKRILVTRLKRLGETVAVTGDGTNDAPALKAADVGFSMGISGTEVAKEASAIVLMDDNFTSIIMALKWGRAVNDAVQKFLQFQITVNITAVLLAFASAVSDPEMRSVLTAVQLLWVNLIMDTFAALALATDPPTERILNRPPQPKRASLITVNMWKMIVGQSIYQLAVTFVLYFAGQQIFPNYTDGELRTVVFNTFVWMQIFNEFNNRRLDNNFNVFEGLHRNKFFILINCLMVGLQVAIIYVGGEAFSIVSDGISSDQWAVSVVLAFLCMPWAILVRIFPDEWFDKVAKTVGTPVVTAYRFLGRFCNRVGGLFKRRKNTDEEANKRNADEETTEGHGIENLTTRNEPADTPMVIVSNTDGLSSPEIKVDDTDGQR